jgi:hypothetical protein
VVTRWCSTSCFAAGIVAGVPNTEGNCAAKDCTSSTSPPAGGKLRGGCYERRYVFAGRPILLYAGGHAACRC